MQHTFKFLLFSFICYPTFCYGITNNRVSKVGIQISTDNNDSLEPIVERTDVNGFMKSVENLLRNSQGRVLEGTGLEECLNDTRLYMDSISKGHLWALTMLDSTGSVPSGILRGNQFEPGNYYECLSIDQRLPDSKRHITGKYCPMHFKLPEKVSLNDTLRNGYIGSQLLNLLGGFKNLHIPVGVTVGFCIPPRCTGSHWTTILSKALEIDVQLYSKCRTADDKPWTRMDIAAAILVPFLGGLMALGTLTEILFKGQKKYMTYQLLIQFSVIANSKRLFSLAGSSQPLDHLHGLRTISMFWIIMRHQHKFVAFGNAASNLLDVAEWSTDLRSAWVYSMQYAVDTFFFLSGFLVTWTALRKYSKEGCGAFAKNLPSFFIKRYIRLVFPLAVIVVVYEGPLSHAFDGPLWFGAPISGRNNCISNLWTNILMINNFVAWEKSCFPHSWYLAADFQMYTMASLLLLAVLKYKKFAKICLPTLAVIATVGFFIVCHINKLAVNPPFSPLNEYYFKPWTHVSVYLIGMTVANAIFNKYAKTVQFRKVVLLVGWFMCLATMTTLVITMTLLSRTGEYSEWHPIHISFSRLLWALCLAWIVFCCYFKMAGPIGFMLNLKFWTILSRLSFCVYLTHGLVIFLSIFSNPGRDYITEDRIVQHYFSTICLSFIYAIVLTLATETPIMGIMQIIFSGKGNATVRPVGTQHQSNKITQQEIREVCKL